jgi:hypothetical protein
LLAVVVLIGGTVEALLLRSPFWFGAAVTSIFVGIGPAIIDRDARSMLVWWLLALTTLPYLGNLIIGLSGLDPFQQTDIILLPMVVLSLFAVSLAMALWISASPQMRFNRAFLTISTFVLYEAILAISGPIGYYGDLWLWTDHLRSNTEFMVFVLGGTMGGLVLTFLLGLYLRHTSLRDFQGTIYGRRAE